MKLSEYTSKDIKEMNYNELIGVTRETNRPPGGVNSILEVLKNTFIDEHSSVLEVGTSTGFTALEIARLSGASVTAIDINEDSLAEGKLRADTLGIANISFEVGNAESLRYDDDSFDVVFCGNVTSIVNNREAALREYARVLRPGGYLVAIPMFYIKEPSSSLLANVSEAIRVDIQVHDKNYWKSMFVTQNLELLKEIDYAFDLIEDAEIEEYVQDILSRDHLMSLSSDARKTLDSQYTSFIQLFRDNLSHMGYSVMILRKTALKLDRELFTGTKKSVPDSL
jgi:ubiquinone/menaquinone biosynthesis C-methylase UbiE